MQIHEIRGRNLREALERARAKLGSQAVVVNQGRSQDGGVALAVSGGVPSDPGVLEAMRQEAQRMVRTPPSVKGQTPSSTRDVQRCLEAAGASRALIQHFTARVEERRDEGLHPLDIAADEVGHLFPVAHAPRTPGRTRLMAFFGHTGVGKTTTVCKLGLRLARQGRRVAFASLDTRHSEELARQAEELGAPLFYGRALQVLVGELRSGEAYDVVLLDTGGSPRRDAQVVARLARGFAQLGAPAALSSYLVLPATASPDTLESAGRALGRLPIAGAVLSKLDETSRTAPVLEHVLREELSVAFLCDGPDIKRHFHRPTADRFADLLLRRRIVR